MGWESKPSWMVRGVGDGRCSRVDTKVVGGVSTEAMLQWPCECLSRGMLPGRIQNSVVVSFLGKADLRESIWRRHSLESECMGSACSLDNEQVLFVLTP